MSFEDISLADPIQQALKEENYGTPTPIQRDAIPVILEGKDIIGCAQTGSGKTAAFALPVLDHFFRKPVELGPKQCRAIVLTPTRELANQVANSFLKYGKHIGVKVGTMVGGMPMGPQIRSLKEGLDVVVATPGRLLDLLEQRLVSFKNADHLILDEVDRMFDMGFIQDVKKIIREVPKSRQTLCFSATMNASVGHLIDNITNDPVKVSVDAEVKSADMVEQHVCLIRNQDKADLAVHFILKERERDPEAKILIFTATKQGADHLLHRFKDVDIKGDALHGDKAQRVRERVLERFRAGKTQVLIATDVAARGLDIKGIDTVLNYDIPKDAETYVHRIGRTGRAGKNGTSYTLCAEFDQQVFNTIENFLGKRMTVYEDHPHHFQVLADQYKALFGFAIQAPSSGGGLIGARPGARRSNRRNRSSRNR